MTWLIDSQVWLPLLASLCLENYYYAAHTYLNTLQLANCRKSIQHRHSTISVCSPLLDLPDASAICDGAETTIDHFVWRLAITVGFNPFSIVSAVPVLYVWMSTAALLKRCKTSRMRRSFVNRMCLRNDKGKARSSFESGTNKPPPITIQYNDLKYIILENNGGVELRW